LIVGQYSIGETGKHQQLLSTQNKRLLPKGDPRRYTAQTVLPTRPQTYRKIVHLLADPSWSALQISKACRVSEHIVRAIREREAKTIAERKRLSLQCWLALRNWVPVVWEETIGKAKLRDAAIGTGIAVDNMLALTGQTPAIAKWFCLHLKRGRNAGLATPNWTR
jgi:hypothetical protein